MIAQISSVATLLILDIIWIMFVMKNQFGTLVNRVQGKNMKVNPYYAALSYTLMVIGLLVFVLPRSTDIKHALLYGASFGVILYGVFDFTNLAIFSDYSLKVAIMDILWGGTVYAIAAVVYSLF